MLSGQQLLLFVKTAIRMLKGRRREQAAFFFAAICFSGGLALTRKLVLDLTDEWIARLQIAFMPLGNRFCLRSHARLGAGYSA